MRGFQEVSSWMTVFIKSKKGPKERAYSQYVHFICFFDKFFITFIEEVGMVPKSN